MAKKKDKTYRAGAYKRLSQDDGRGEVSNSIINQTELIKDYGKSHSDIEIVAEYDDATDIIGLKQNPTNGRRFSPIFFVYRAFSA